MALAVPHGGECSIKITFFHIMSAGGTLFLVGNYQEMHKKPLLDVFYRDNSNASTRYTAVWKVHNRMCSAAPAKELYHSNDDAAAAESNGC